LATAIGAGLLVWDHWFRGNAGYPLEVIKQADEMDRLLSFDSHITVPVDFGTAGNEVDKDGSGQFDLAKAARGRLSGVGADRFRWPEI
jgi:hypothetical protein